MHLGRLGEVFAVGEVRVRVRLDDLDLPFGVHAHVDAGAAVEVERPRPAARRSTRAGDIKVVTTGFREGYVRKNGVPYIEAATITKYMHRLPAHPNGDVYMNVITTAPVLPVVAKPRQVGILSTMPLPQAFRLGLALAGVLLTLAAWAPGAAGVLAQAQPKPKPASGSARTMVAFGGVFSPYILYDQARREFRLWHQAPGTNGGRIDVVHRRSPDARTWSAPVRVHSGDAWGPVVIPYHGRYRWLFYQIDKADLTKQGVYAAESSDGLSFRKTHGPLLTLADGAGDIVDPFYDPIRKRWASFVKVFADKGEFGSDPKLATVRRLTGLTIASDFMSKWSKPVRVFVPDKRDQGVVEFYGAACCVVRGDTLVAFLRVLRDDVGEGIGYTVLAWSKDGRTWERAREPFLNRCASSKRFDAAMAWVYGVTEHNGRTYLSYSGYDTGHKTGMRGIGVAEMPSEDISVPNGRGPACGR